MEAEKRIPQVGEYVRGIGTLVAIERTDPPPPPQPVHDYVFEEITARYEVRLGDEVLNTSGTWWDCFGLGTSVKSAIDAAKKYAAEKSLGPGSDVEVVAIKIVTRLRKQPSRSLPNPCDAELPYYEAKEIGRACGMPRPVETILWSSKNPEGK